MEQIITGSIRIANNDCPYSYDNNTEKITIYIGDKIISFPEGTDTIVGQKYGMLSGGKTLFKLIAPLSNDGVYFEGDPQKHIAIGDQIRPVDYYIEGYEENSKYTEIRFRFPELNYFIPSIGQAAIINEQIAISCKEKELFSFDFKYHNIDVHIAFATTMEGICREKVTVETFTEVKLTFPKTNDVEFIKGLYEIVRCFFTFICNRQNIGLRNAVLLGSYPAVKFINTKITDDARYTKQKIVFSQKYLEPEESNKVIATTPSWRLFSDQLTELFMLFSNDINESGPIVNVNSIHPSIKYRNLIDLEQSLRITATFEYYLRTLLPEISSQSTIEFFDDMRKLLDEYIEESTGDKKKKARKFRNALYPQIALEDKIIKVYDGYSGWQPLKPILSEWFSDDIIPLAKTANSWRNELAHEKREHQPTIDVVKAIRLLEHINYCIILRKAGYTDKQIKIIVEEVLTR